jgi:hypothetical protein
MKCLSRLSMEPTLRRVFHWYGGVAYRFRWTLFAVPILISTVLSSGFLWFTELRIDDPGSIYVIN